MRDESKKGKKRKPIQECIIPMGWLLLRVTSYFENLLRIMKRASKLFTWDFPGGPVVKNLSSNAVDAGLIPGRGTKIPHAVGQLSPRTTTTEFASLNERARVLQTTEPTCPGASVPQLERENTHAITREKPARHNEEPVLQRKILHASTKIPQLRPGAAKKNKLNK